VKAKLKAPSLYEAWAAGVRAGQVVVSNGPLLDLTVNGSGPGALLNATGTLQGEAVASFHRPLERLEIIVNGKVEASRDVAGQREARLPFRIPRQDSSWVAARVTSPGLQGEPVIQAHTNPVYVLRDGQPVSAANAREALRARWEAQAAYYRNTDLIFSREQERAELIAKVDEALQVLRSSRTPAYRRQLSARTRF
jgi:hypothetical protein